MTRTIRHNAFDLTATYSRAVHFIPANAYGLTCHRILIQRQLESRGFVRHLARVEQRAIGGAGRGCAAERSLR